MKLRALSLAALVVVAAPAHAGLFDDDVARQQIQLLEGRISALENTAKQQQENDAQRTRTLLDLQSQIDAMNADLRNLRGQSEELANGLQVGEKRQKDFYLDLDTRLRRLEPPEPDAASAPASAPQGSAAPAANTDNIVAENRTYEVAHNLFRAAKYQDAITALQAFLNKYPDSVYIPNALYELGASYDALQDCTNAMTAYRLVSSRYDFSPKAPDAMLGTASCQQKLKAVDSAKKTLKQLISKYPESGAAQEAKKRLAERK